MTSAADSATYVTRRLPILTLAIAWVDPTTELVGHTGFEPVMTESKSVALPLGECPIKISLVPVYCASVLVECVSPKINGDIFCVLFLEHLDEFVCFILAEEISVVVGVHFHGRYLRSFMLYLAYIIYYTAF